jgi:terminase small subunit-like protein
MNADPLLTGTTDTRSETNRLRDPANRQQVFTEEVVKDKGRHFKPEERAACVAEALKRISLGETMRQIALLPHMPQKSELWLWLNTPENRAAKDLAYVAQAEVLRDELRDIAEDGRNDWMTITNERGKEVVVLNKEHVQRSKLRIDTLQWLMGVSNRRKYGQHSTVDVNATVAVTVEQAAGKLGNLMGRLAGATQAANDRVATLPLVERLG